MSYDAVSVGIEHLTCFCYILPCTNHHVLCRITMATPSPPVKNEYSETDLEPTSLETTLSGTTIFPIVKNTIYHWITCKLNLLGWKPIWKDHFFLTQTGSYWQVSPCNSETCECRCWKFLCQFPILAMHWKEHPYCHCGKVVFVEGWSVFRGTCTCIFDCDI